MLVFCKLGSVENSLTFICLNKYVVPFLTIGNS